MGSSQSAGSSWNCSPAHVDIGCTRVCNKCHDVKLLSNGTEVDNEVAANWKLLRASNTGDLLGVREAIEAGASIETRPNLIMYLSESGARREDEEDMMLQSRPGLTPLMQAAKEGWVEGVTLLLHAKAALYAKDEDGMMPLHFAASAGCLECCATLLDAHAAPWERDDNGRDAFACLPQDRLLWCKERTTWTKLLRDQRDGDAIPAPVARVAHHPAWDTPIRTSSPGFGVTLQPYPLESSSPELMWGRDGL